MRAVVPYANIEALLHAVDDGGSVLDLFSRKNDGQVSRGELFSAALVEDRLTYLWLALVTSEFSASDRARLPRVLADRVALEFSRLDTTPHPPRRFATAKEGERLLIDGVLMDAPSSTKSIPFWISPSLASALGLEYFVWELVGASSHEGRALVLQSSNDPQYRPPAIDDSGLEMRIAGVVTTVKHDDGRPIKHLRPIFYWDRTRPLVQVTDMERKRAGALDSRDALREVLRHTPAARTGDDDG
jgi:hypothetical protein